MQGRKMMQMSLAITKHDSGCLFIIGVCDQVAGKDLAILGLLRFPSSIRPVYSEYRCPIIRQLVIRGGIQ